MISKTFSFAEEYDYFEVSFTFMYFGYWPLHEKSIMDFFMNKEFAYHVK